MKYVTVAYSDHAAVVYMRL